MFIYSAQARKYIEIILPTVEFEFVDSLILSYTRRIRVRAGFL